MGRGTCMPAFFRRAWYLFKRRQIEADVADEMAFHREMAARQLERDGQKPSDASLQAQRSFGSVALAMDRTRDVWIPAGMRDLSHDVRFAVRLFIKDRWFAVVAVATLALSLGFNATLFTIVSGMGGTPPVD